LPQPYNEAISLYEALQPGMTWEEVEAILGSCKIALQDCGSLYATWKWKGYYIFVEFERDFSTGETWLLDKGIKEIPSPSFLERLRSWVRW
jgi:hypothetical protein